LILSLEKVRELFPAFNDWTDDKLNLKLCAVENALRAYTNNKFHNRYYRNTADIIGGVIISNELCAFTEGDTVEISYGRAKGLYTVKETSDFVIEVNENIPDAKDVVITKVEYPADVVYCAINILDWELNNRAKVGIQSETLSRHSVTYFNYDSSNIMGYPSSLFGALQPYKKARC
jgi:hypothetical protein